MSQRFVIVANIRSFLCLLLKAQRTGSDGNAITVFQGLLITRLAIDEDLVCASSEFTVDNRSIDENEGTVIARFNVGVITRGTRIIQNHDIVGRTADRARGLRDQGAFPLTSARICNLEECHEEEMEPGFVPAVSRYMPTFRQID